MTRTSDIGLSCVCSEHYTCYRCHHGLDKEDASGLEAGETGTSSADRAQEEDIALRVLAFYEHVCEVEGRTPVLSSLRVLGVDTQRHISNIARDALCAPYGAKPRSALATRLFDKLREQRSDMLVSPDMVREVGDYRQIEARVLAWMEQEVWPGGHPCVLWDEADGSRVSPFTYARPEPGQVCVLRRRDGSIFVFSVQTPQQCTYVRNTLKAVQYIPPSGNRGYPIVNTDWRVCPEWVAAWYFLFRGESSKPIIPDEWIEWAGGYLAGPGPSGHDWRPQVAKVLRATGYTTPAYTE